jgi:hypothetical protein
MVRLSGSRESVHVTMLEGFETHQLAAQYRALDLHGGKYTERRAAREVPEPWSGSGPDRQTLYIEAGAQPDRDRLVVPGSPGRGMFFTWRVMIWMA